MMIAMASEVAATTISVSAAIPVLALATSGHVAALLKDALFVELLASLILALIEFLSGEQAWATVLFLHHDVSVVERLDVFVQAGTFFLLRLFDKLFEYIDEDVSVECSVVLLREAQWSTLPIADLLDLTNLLAEHTQGDLRKTRLLLYKANFTEERLSINESFNILHELKVRVLSCELLDIGRETKADDDAVFVVEHLAHGRVK